jgi:hypothetical protein
MWIKATYFGNCICHISNSLYLKISCSQNLAQQVESELFILFNKDACFEGGGNYSPIG